MKKTLSFIPIFFMLAAMNAQEQEVPAVPEVPSISEDKEEEKVVKVELVKNTSFEEPETYGNHEIRLNFFDLLLMPGIHVYYEKIIDANSSYGSGLFFNLGGDDIIQRRFAISPYYRLYFLNRKDFGAKGYFVEMFGSLATSDYQNDNILRPSVGLTLGRKSVTRSGFSFEPFFGVGRYLDEKYPTSNDYPEIHLRFGFSIGKRF